VYVTECLGIEYEKFLSPESPFRRFLNEPPSRFDSTGLYRQDVYSGELRACSYSCIKNEELWPIRAGHFKCQCFMGVRPGRTS